MGDTAGNLAIARRYLKAIESGSIADEFASLFSPDIVVEIFPSRFFPNGSRDDLAGIPAAAERGKKAMSRQEYHIRNEVADGDQVALEIDWVGTLAVPFQDKPKGSQMRAHFAAFLQFKNGKIISQRNYDCYEP
ncbi:MAG TPA: nuclear transport factor 2 family protein [Candidatus Acidoferrum sp.]|nr:nuclear transport factor 2 family protein [Candidatus Acidoferrum sp.]